MLYVMCWCPCAPHSGACFGALEPPTLYLIAIAVEHKDEHVIEQVIRFSAQILSLMISVLDSATKLGSNFAVNIQLNLHWLAVSGPHVWLLQNVSDCISSII